MTHYLIALYGDQQARIPAEEMPQVGADVGKVCEEIIAAGHWVFGGGMHAPEETLSVGTDGVWTDGPLVEAKEYLGGFSVVDVPDLETAKRYAAMLAIACRCPQEVRAFLDEDEVRALHGETGEAAR